MPDSDSAIGYFGPRAADTHKLDSKKKPNETQPRNIQIAAPRQNPARASNDCRFTNGRISNGRIIALLTRKTRAPIAKSPIAVGIIGP